MSQVHIRSQHRVAGTQSAYSVTLNGPVTGEYTLLNSYVENKPIPWIWSGVDRIDMIRDLDGVTYTAYLGELVDDTPANAAIAVNAAFLASGAFGYIDTVATATDLVVTFASSYTINWITNSNNSARHIFKKLGDETAIVHNLTLDNVYNNPEHIYVVIDETSSTSRSNFGTNPDIVVATQGEPFIAHQKVTFNNVSTLTVRTYRASSAGVVCPVPVDMEFLFSNRV